MGLLNSLLVGRPNGVRSRIKARLGLGGAAAPESPAPTVKPGAFGGGASAPAPRAPTPVSSEPAEKVLKLKKEPPKDVTPPEGYEVVLHKDALEKGRIIEIIIAGTAIAVAHVDDQYFAIANACPHADGPLGEGQLDGRVVTCPYHGWQFDVADGSCKTNPYAKVTTYPVQVVGDAVCVKL